MAESPHWIAVVDDDPSVLKALHRTLRVRAFETKTYSSAQEFIASLSEGTPQCLIVDLQMPEMSGLELHRHLTSRGTHVPTIIMTAHPGAEVQQRCEAAGAIFLAKPLQNALLFDAITRAIRTAGTL
jgi:FixJ family two-component response regulator